jgi:hypothetical protein
VENADADVKVVQDAAVRVNAEDVVVVVLAEEEWVENSQHIPTLLECKQTMLLLQLLNLNMNLKRQEFWIKSQGCLGGGRVVADADADAAQIKVVKENAKEVEELATVVKSEEAVKDLDLEDTVN